MRATNKTSTMQKEMQQAAEAGFRFGDVMGGDTAFGGSEVVVIMHRGAAADRFDYRLLATNKTSTMQKEMQEGGDAGFEYRGQTVFKSAFGGKEVVASWSGRSTRRPSSSTNTAFWLRRKHPPCRRSLRKPATRATSLSG
ncbi:MAG: hypothetical protein H0U19_02110 [Acidobacteria bacterium]|nr:hypothetical protein [Acidobacteriota bacterium]